jgi:hypothetical protein
MKNEIVTLAPIECLPLNRFVLLIGFALIIGLAIALA